MDKKELREAISEILEILANGNYDRIEILYGIKQVSENMFGGQIIITKK